MYIQLALLKQMYLNRKRIFSLFWKFLGSKSETIKISTSLLIPKTPLGIEPNITTNFFFGIFHYIFIIWYHIHFFASLFMKDCRWMPRPLLVGRMSLFLLILGTFLDLSKFQITTIIWWVGPCTPVSRKIL